MNLSNETNQVLLTMYKTGSVNKNQLSPTALRELFQNGYIVNSSNYHDNNIYLTDKGRAYVEEVKSDKLRFWIPVIISIMALLIALASLIIDIYQLVNANVC